MLLSDGSKCLPVRLTGSVTPSLQAFLQGQKNTRWINMQYIEILQFYLQTFKIHHQFLENIAYSSIAPHLWTCACPQFAMIHSSNRGASSCHVEYVHHFFLVQIDMATRQGCRLANVRPQLCEYSCVNTATGWQLDGCLLKVWETERKNVANITSFGAENEGFWLYQLRRLRELELTWHYSWAQHTAPIIFTGNESLHVQSPLASQVQKFHPARQQIRLHDDPMLVFPQPWLWYAHSDVWPRKHKQYPSKPQPCNSEQPVSSYPQALSRMPL